MRIIANLLSAAFILFFSFTTEAQEKIKFVEKGKLHSDLTHNGWQEQKGYLQSHKEFLLKGGEAISGDEWVVNLKISLGKQDGQVRITVADNMLGITSDIGFAEGFSLSPQELQELKGKGKIVFLQGPSIGSSIFLGMMDTYIKPDKPFVLQIMYKDGSLSYEIDNQSVYSAKPALPPAGRVNLWGYGANTRIYDIICNGQFLTLEDLYNREYLLNRAQKSVDAAAQKVKGDPNRPAYHFQPPANWNNDPNGMLYYEGYYHMFYQHNPFADVWDWMHWGHARSKDMIHWEHLPIALWPSLEKGEVHCFSGSGFIMDNGKPILLYTSIGHDNPEQWAALPSDDALINWEKHPANPILVMEDHGGQHIDSWRDPFLFREADGTYMVIGGHPKDSTGSLMMYKAKNTELTDWQYLGVAFSGEEKNWECPNFFKVGDQYVMLYSPHDRVEYYTGSLDTDKVRFTPRHRGLIDNGGFWNYYAPNTLQTEDGRRLLFGWIHGFKTGQGWQGAISLPRDLSIDEQGRLLQVPVAELAQLRGDAISLTNINPSTSSLKLDLSNPQFELLLNIAATGTNNIGFRFNGETGEPVEIVLTPEKLYFVDDTVAVDPPLGEKIRKVQFFFDRSVVEIFVNGGLLCATKVIYPNRDNLKFEIFSADASCTVESLKMWQLKSIW